ncbi:MAG TPA: hypothetical protein VK997_06605 [Deferrisomatales bacterium]|nr:hypothetical protein [Deferrisomatales bacterium]
MLNCRETSQLVSKGMEAKLSLPERLGLALHLRMCDNCATYRRQLGQLREVLRRGVQELPDLPALRAFTLSTAERSQLTRTLADDPGS